MVTKLCSSCSTLSETEKTFCPECGTPFVKGPNPGATAKRSNGKALTSMILGICGLVLFGVILGVIALVFALIARNEIDAENPPTSRNRGQATAGLVLGIIDIVFGFWWIWWLI